MTSDGWFTPAFLELLCWVVALFSTTLLVVQLTFGVLLDGLDGHLDGLFDGSAGHLYGGGLKALLAALMVAGWGGVLSFTLTRLPPFLIVALTLGAGAITFATTIWLLRRLRYLESDGTLQIANAIGKFGTVYLSIPARGTGRGQIQVEVQGRLMTLEAMSDGPAIPTGVQVFVHGARDGALLVMSNDEINPLGAASDAKLQPTPFPFSVSTPSSNPQ
ncbi:MAG: hypothetical protein ACUVR8_09325 [Acidobacteriota bacterium]